MMPFETSETDVPWFETTNLSTGDVLAFDGVGSECVALLAQDETYRLYHASDECAAWSVLGPGIPAGHLPTALTTTSDRIYIGSLQDGVISASYGNGADWERAGVGLPRGTVVTTLTALGDVVYLGSRAHGLYVQDSKRWRPIASKRIHAVAGLSVSAILAADGWVIVLAGRSLFVLDPNAPEHVVDEYVLPSSSLGGIVRTGPGAYIAWAMRRVIRSGDGGASWSALPDLSSQSVWIRSAAPCGRDIVVGLHGAPGLIRWRADHGRWESLGHLSHEAVWSAVVYARPTHLLVGLGGAGIVRIPLHDEDPAHPALAWAGPDDTENVQAPTLRIRLRRAAEVRVYLVSDDGSASSTIVLGILPEGTHEVVIDDGTLPTGFYSYTVEVEGIRRFGRRLILRS